MFLHHNHSLACREAEYKLREGGRPGLARCQTESEGAVEVAKVFYQHQGSEIKIRLDELSGGQKNMVIMKHALAMAIAGRSTVLIDEPANFSGLAEIQPFRLRLQNGADEGQTQAVVTSHHPEADDLLAGENGRWLERTPLGPVQISIVSALLAGAQDPAIPLAELVARSWVSSQPRPKPAFSARQA